MAESVDERRSRLIYDIKNESPSVVISRWVLDPIPYIFDANITAFSTWRHVLADGIGVDPREVLITGTACTGVSLNPHKSFKAFDAGSDVDVAVISGYHFEAAWRTLRQTGARTLFREPRMRTALEDHKTRLIYWGTIATDKSSACCLRAYPSRHKYRRARSLQRARLSAPKCDASRRELAQTGVLSDTGHIVPLQDASTYTSALRLGAPC
jgi:hypothetical protein